MTPERWAKVQAVFHSALDRPPSKRQTFLEAECGANVELRREVQSLLEHHESTGPIGSLRDQPPHPERVGPYDIIRPLGEGGMGTVYLGERSEGDFRQLVAIKLIRSGFADSQLQERLRSERRILASLEHPGIARFIDGGATAAGQPYYAMEYVEGIDLLQYCDGHRLSIADRVRLFLEVCAAVHHAHQRLVVHRDLKPANILVTEDGYPKLLDFGIAKLLDDQSHGVVDPNFSAAWLTPAYASPEQVRADPVGTLSDVYSLGVVLYELLSGARPYDVDGSTPAQIRRAICEFTPERPSIAVQLKAVSDGKDTDDARRRLEQLAAARSTVPERLRRSLRGDLDTIVLRALAKDPARRYASTEQLAEDLSRHLTGRPVRARSDSMRYRTMSFLRRHRVAVPFAAATILSLVTGAAGSAWQASEASRARANAEIALQEVQQALSQSDRLTRFLLDLFESSDPYVASVDTLAGRELLRRGLVQAEGLQGEPDLQATMFDALAQIYRNLRQYDRARELLERALELRIQRFGDRAPETLEIKSHLGLVLTLLGEYDVAESLHREVLRARRVDLAANDPLVAEAIINVARVLPYQGRSRTAEQLLREALIVQRRGHGADHPAVAATMDVLSNLVRGRDPEQAQELLRQALSIHQTSRGPDDPHVASTMLRLGDIRWDVFGDYEEAESLFRGALEIQRNAYGEATCR